MLSETNKGRGIFEPIAAFMNAVARRLNHFRVFGSGRVVVSESGIDLYIEPEAFPWTLLGFGYSISGGTVTIYPGEIQHALSAATVTAQVDRTITANLQYVWVEYVYATRVISIPTPSVTKPVSTDGTYRKWLYQFSYVAPVAPSIIPAVSLLKIGNMGNIVIPT